MLSWSAHLLPGKNMIRLYRRDKDLTQIKSPNPTNRKELVHKFANLTRKELFAEAERVLEDSGFEVFTAWSRDENFDIWYVGVRSPEEV